MKVEKADGGRAAQAASRTLDVIEFFAAQQEPVSAETVSAACNIPRSTLYNLLRMLRGRGYVEYKRAARGWVCGPRLSEHRADGVSFRDGLAIIETLSASGRSLATEEIVARSLLSHDTVTRVLDELHANAVVTTQADGTICLGSQLVALGSSFGWTERLQALARPILVRLRDASGETASLVVQDGDNALYLDQVESPFELRCAGWTGRRVSRQGTSAGAAFDDASRPHIVADAVEPGVTAITAAAAGISPPVGVNVIGPTWRVAERGIDELTALVVAAAAELAAAYVANRGIDG
ncbi:MAG: helix-turn-helix domain-containing protein [Thermoleophilia bacterium]